MCAADVNRASDADDVTATWDPQGPGGLHQPQLPPRWRLGELLGRGGQATVWHAHDLELGCAVALKVFACHEDRIARERLRREVRAGRTVNSPHLVRTFELVECANQLVLVMELMTRGTLADEVRQQLFEPEAVVSVAEQALEALAALHEAGIVHRDVKPSNLLRDETGNVRLGDLGLVRRMDQDSDLTRAADTVGTVSYMSPEQLRGESASPASDLYALGATLFRLLTGAPPFRASSEWELARLHESTSPPDLRRQRPDCPRWLAQFVARLLEKRPHDRWENAGEAVRALQQRRVRASPRQRRRRALAVAVTAAAMLAGLGSVRLLERLRPVPAAVQVVGDQAVVVDASGHDLWSYGLGSADAVSLVSNVVGSASPEVILALNDGPPEARRCSIVVFSSSGRELMRHEVSAICFMRSYPEVAPGVKALQLVAADLDGDQLDDLAWLGNHPVWFPSQVGAWCPRRGSEPRTLFVHSGHLYSLLAWDRDGDGRDELLALGLNNPLGFQSVVAVLSSAASGERPMTSPDVISAVELMTRKTWPSQLVDYILVGGGWGARDRLQALADEIAAQRSADGARDGAGSDLRMRAMMLSAHEIGPRMSYWKALQRLALRVEQRRTKDLTSELTRFRLDHVEVMSEPSYDLAAVMLLGRSMLRADGAGDAVRWLELARQRHGGAPRLGQMLGTALVLNGQRGAALEAWMEVLRQPEACGAEVAESLEKIAWLAAADGRTRTFDRAFEHVRLAGTALVSDRRESDLLALWAFLQGQWDDPALDIARAFPGLRIVEPMREWAQVERGGDLTSSLRKAMQWREDPELEDLARLLAARIELERGHPERAVGHARRALERLGNQPSVQGLLIEGIAHHLQALAHQRLGNEEQCTVHQRELRQAFPRQLFGQAW